MTQCPFCLYAPYSTISHRMLPGTRIPHQTQPRLLGSDGRPKYLSANQTLAGVARKSFTAFTVNDGRMSREAACHDAILISTTFLRLSPRTGAENVAMTVIATTVAEPNRQIDFALRNR